MVAGYTRRQKDRLPPLVGRGTTKPPEPLAESHAYTNVGRDSIFTASPSIVHFGGYELQKPHSKKILIRNTSSQSQRCHILFPTTPYFKVKCKKKGLLAPGMAEEVEVIFCAPKYKYYYDCLRIHSPDVNFTIPIHAYPVMNDVIFPKRIVFPNLRVGEKQVRVYTLKCKIPVSFEFRFELLNYNPDWKVLPLKGVVPASGTVDIHVEFQPSDRITSSLKMRVNMSQFGFKPFVCEMVGSATTTLEQSDQEYARTVSWELDQREKRKPNFGETWAPRMRKRHTSVPPLQSDARETSQTNKVEGHTIPSWIGTSQCLVNTILMQDPKKQRERELRIQLRQQQADANRAAEEEAKQARETMMGELEEGAAEHPFDYSSRPNTKVEFEGSTLDMKRIVFEHEFTEYVNYEKSLEIKPSVCRIGQQPPSEEQLQEARAALERGAAESLLQQQLEDCARQTTMLSTAPVSVPIDMDLKVTPDFDAYKQSTMGMRRQVLERFRKAATKVVLQCRANRRLDKMKRFFEQREAGRDATTSLQTDEEAHACPVELDPTKVAMPFAREALDESHLSLEPVEVEEIAAPEPELAKFDMAEALEYKVRGYTPFKNTKLPSAGPVALPDLTETPLGRGAEEEYQAIPASGPRQVNRQVRTLPDHLRNAPYVAPWRMLRSDPKARPKRRNQTPDEADIRWPLRPTKLAPTQLSRRAMTLGGMDGFTIRGSSLSNKFRQRLESRFVNLRSKPKQMRRGSEEDYYSDSDEDGEDKCEMVIPSSDPAQIHNMFFGVDADAPEQDGAAPEPAASERNQRSVALREMSNNARKERDEAADNVGHKLKEINEKIDSASHPLREVRPLMC